MPDLDLFAGDTLVISVSVTDSAGEEVDIGDATALRWQMARSVDGLPLIEKALGSGIEFTESALGKCDVTLDPEDTEDVPPGFYYYEAEIVLADVTSTFAAGWIQIKPTLIKPVDPPEPAP